MWFIKYQTLDIEFLIIWLAPVAVSYPVACPNMENDNFIMENFSLKMAENSSQ